MPRPQGVWLLAPLLLLTLFCRIINWQKLEVGKCEKVAGGNYSTDQQLPSGEKEEEEEQILRRKHFRLLSDNCRRFFTAHLSMQSKQDWGNWQLFRITVLANQWAAGCLYYTICLNSLFSLTKSLSCQTCSGYRFLATLVALHSTPVSKSVSGQSFGLQPSSVAWSLRACLISYFLQRKDINCLESYFLDVVLWTTYNAHIFTSSSWQESCATHLLISDSRQIPNTCFLSARQSQIVDYAHDSCHDSRNVFRIYPWHFHRLSFLMSPPVGWGDASYGVEHFKNHSARSSSPNHLLPHLCRWHTRWGVSQKGAAVALRSGIVSLTRISSCISSPGLGFGSHCQHEVYCDTRFTPLCVWRVQICVSLCLCVFVFVHWVYFVFFPVS